LGRRWSRDDLPDGLRIRIPVRPRWAAIPLLLWLVVWAVEEGRALGSVLRHEGSSQFLGLWLALWTVGGLITIGLLLWRLVGEVVIEVSDGVMEYRVSLGLVSFGRSYDLRLVRELRAAEAESGPLWPFWRTPWFGRERGRIRFGYGARSVSLRPGLNPSDAKHLVDLIDPFVPRGGPSRRYSAAIS